MNQTPAILGASGAAMVEFGGTKAWRLFTKGDIAISLQWINTGDESGEDQPCMCLYPANRRMDGGAYVLPQSEAYRFADRKGNPTPHVMGAAFKYCAVTNTFPDKSTIHRVMDVILEYMPELIRMPSYPQELLEAKQKREMQGIEVALKVDGKVIHDALV